MIKMIGAVDESGDLGFEKNSSSHFMVASILIADKLESQLIIDEVVKYCRELGWGNKHEFKFAKTPKPYILEILQRLNRYHFQVYAVYIDKNDFEILSPQILPLFDQKSLYNWFLKELLCDMKLNDARILIDGHYSKRDEKNTISYLRKEVRNEKYDHIEFKFKDSKEDKLVQIADLIVGAINRFIVSEKSDSKKYVALFKDKIVSIRRIKVIAENQQTRRNQS